MSFLVKSTSGEFYCDIAGLQYISGDDRRYAVYSKAMRGHPVAWIRQDSGAVIGVQGNTGNRLDRLSGIERADIATLVHLLVEIRFVARLPTDQEQKDAQHNDVIAAVAARWEEVVL